VLFSLPFIGISLLIAEVRGKLKKEKEYEKNRRIKDDAEFAEESQEDE